MVNVVLKVKAAVDCRKGEAVAATKPAAIVLKGEGDEGEVLAEVFRALIYLILPVFSGSERPVNLISAKLHFLPHLS